MKKVVVIGGGNGTAKGIRALKPYLDKLELSAVVSMSDSGGSSGKLRREFGILPPGDILRAVLAMSRYDYEILKNIFRNNRLEESGHSLGNLILKDLAGPSRDMLRAVRALEQAVEAVGKVYPATLTDTELVVELDNGQEIVGEAEIDRPSYSRNLRIKKAKLIPDNNIAFTEAMKVIEEADYIVLPPGSLYTSLIAAMLPRGFKEAIKKSQAKVIAVMSKFYEKDGETGPRSVHEYLSELEEYLGRKIDCVVYNDSELNPDKMEENKKQGWELYDLDEEKLKPYNFIKADLERDEGFAIDPEKLGKELMKIIKQY